MDESKKKDRYEDAKKFVRYSDNCGFIFCKNEQYAPFSQIS